MFMKNAGISRVRTAGTLSKASDLVQFFLMTKIMGQRLPLMASFKLTYRCNLACSACPFHRRAREEGSHMSWHTALTSLERLRRMGCRIVIFEGGEPLLWRDSGHDFSELARHAARDFLCVGATTNGPQAWTCRPTSSG
jgi:MoaA/NifB/PqqE/SkfB family radical SAM enzyme